MHQAVLSNSTTAPAGRESQTTKKAAQRQMSEAHRATLSEVMTLAWRKLRYERIQGATCSMGTALRHAWAWLKGEAARFAAQAASRAAWDAEGRKVTHLRSILRSPIQRSLSGQSYAGARDYQAARLTGLLSR